MRRYACRCFAGWLLLLLLTGRSAAAQDLVGLYLTWRDDPSTTMTVNWVDLYADSSTVTYYKALGEEAWSEARAVHSQVGPSTLQLRRAELTGLRADTVYQFGIGKAPRTANEGWRFRTMPAELSRPVRFVAGGDMMHSREMVDAMNRQAAKLDPDFALLGGDLAYENGVAASRIADWLGSWMQISVGKDRRLIPMVVAIGNHEVRGGYKGRIPDDAPYFYSLFALPQDRSYYALNFGTYLSLVVLDSDHTQAIAGAQADWLREALAERTDQQFLFACYHYPAYGTTKAPRGKLPIDAPRSVAIRKYWTPHFEQFGVSAVFENDHHNFKRSHRLRAHRRDDENGILYLGDGAWGVKTREVPSPEVGWWLAKAEPRNHLWSVELRPGGTATIQAVDVAGQVFDEVQLSDPRTRPATEMAAADRSLREGEPQQLFADGTLRGWVEEQHDFFITKHPGGVRTWSVEDGVVRCDGSLGNCGFLRYEKKLGDFKIQLEYRMPRDCNSGLGIRAPAPYNGRAETLPSRTAFEVQIKDDAGQPPSSTSSGSFYGLLAPRVSAAKAAGEWNSLEILCRGSRILVTLNGQVVQDVDQREVPEIKGRPHSGFLSLQNHGHSIELRNLRLTELSEHD